MSITLTHDQQDAIEQAIEAGLVGSVKISAEFIGTAVNALSHGERVFDPEKARFAVARIRELRKGVTLDLQGMSFRELAHAGRKY